METLDYANIIVVIWSIISIGLSIVRHGWWWLNDYTTNCRNPIFEGVHEKAGRPLYGYGLDVAFAMWLCGVASIYAIPFVGEAAIKFPIISLTIGVITTAMFTARYLIRLNKKVKGLS